MNKYIAHFPAKDFLDIIFIKFLIFWQKFCNPCSMFLDFLIGSDVPAA